MSWLFNIGIHISHKIYTVQGELILYHYELHYSSDPCMCFSYLTLHFYSINTVT